jgi:hypothetical protein
MKHAQPLVSLRVFQVDEPSFYMARSIRAFPGRNYALRLRAFAKFSLADSERAAARIRRSRLSGGRVTWIGGGLAGCGPK